MCLDAVQVPVFSDGHLPVPDVDMSCCGTARTDAPNNANNEKIHPNGIIQQQPLHHTGMMGTPIHQPQPVAPPMAYQPNRQSSFGPPSLHQSPQMGMASPPPMGQFGQMNSMTGTTLMEQSMHAKDATNSSFRASTISPPLMTAYPQGGTMNQLGGMGMSPTPQVVSYTQSAPDEGKMSVSIDFGTTFSGVVSILFYYFTSTVGRG